MIPKRFPRSITANWLILALILAAMAGPALTAAAIPSVYISVERTPEATRGELVGFKITVDNRGNSTSSQSMASATVPAGTTYAGVYPSSMSCSQATGLVTCDLGSIPGKTSVTFSLTFQTTSATTSPVTTTVRGFTTGTPGDPGGNSHGDDFIGSGLSYSIALVLAANGDFSGRFVTTNLVVQNNQTVGSSNLQATKLTAPTGAIGVSVKDGPASSVPNLGACTLGPSVCNLLFSQNSAIYVDGNTVFETAFPVTVTFSKFEIPGGINETNIAIYHTWTDASGYHEETISTRCTPSSGTPSNPQCLTATKSSVGITVIVWLFHNGNIKGY